MYHFFIIDKRLCGPDVMALRAEFDPQQGRIQGVSLGGRFQ